MRALDFYCGVGGWSLGLEMSGVKVVDGYEWWLPAARSYELNLGAKPKVIDIRELSVKDLPKQIDIVVGSPPCTQFSFSNRGGNGDVVEGLKDIKKFLDIVDHVKPRWWAMENVPRVRQILETEIYEKRGALRDYRHLFDEPGVHIEVFDMSFFGLSQSRKRCIAGKYPIERLNGFRNSTQSRTLGDVVSALEGKVVVDPHFRFSLPRHLVSEHSFEGVLSNEERIINRHVKQLHPIYNSMSFPDSLERPSRTVTATCTRVSRESIVIRTKKGSKHLRRLTVRERATLQGFPIDYQFYGDSENTKMKLVGNAIPPLFTFVFAQALRGVEPNTSDIKNSYRGSKAKAEIKTGSTERPRRFVYPANRRFRFSVPSLHFKSGVRFQFENVFEGESRYYWRFVFKYGIPSDIRTLTLDRRIRQAFCRTKQYRKIRLAVSNEVSRIADFLGENISGGLQDVWSRRRETGPSPFDVLDTVDVAVGRIVSMVKDGDKAFELVTEFLKKNECTRWQQKKFREYAIEIFVGMILCSHLNEIVFYREMEKAVA